jgi:hypothetical protein
VFHDRIYPYLFAFIIVLLVPLGIIYIAFLFLRVSWYKETHDSGYNPALAWVKSFSMLTIIMLGATVLFFIWASSNPIQINIWR